MPDWDREKAEGDHQETPSPRPVAPPLKSNAYLYHPTIIAHHPHLVDCDDTRLFQHPFHSRRRHRHHDGFDRLAPSGGGRSDPGVAGEEARLGCPDSCSV